MSLRSIQTQRALEEVMRSMLTQGISPSARRAQAEVAERFAWRAAGAPRFSPHLWSRRERVPIDSYNQDVKDLGEDLSVLFQDAAAIRDRSGEIERVLSEEAAALRARALELSSRVERILMDLAPARGFTAWSVEDFSSLDGTDTSRSKALVDSEHRKALLPISASDGDVATEDEVTLDLDSDGKLTVESPAGWMFSPYDNQAASFLIESRSDQATLELRVAMKRPGRLSRIRLDATSGTSYGLRIEIEDSQGSSHSIHDGMVSYPLELPVGEQVSVLRLTFQLTEPARRDGESRLFRLVVPSLQLFREWSTGEADWVSKPIPLPDHALYGQMTWEGEAGDGGRFEGFVELLDQNGSLVTSMPVSSGQVFPVRAGGSRSLEFDACRFASDSGSSTLPLWRASGLFPSGSRLIGPKLWVGWGQWKRRVFRNEWAASLPPTHIPGPSDWAEFHETVLADVSYVDQGSSLPAGAMPAASNVLVSFSTYIEAPKDGEVSFSGLQIQNARFSLYVNGKKIGDDASIKSGRVAFAVRQGLNPVQLYLRTTGATPSIALGNTSLVPGSTLRAERDPAVWVDPYSVRKASPPHPRLWVAMEAGAVILRFDPNHGGSKAKFRIEYTSPNEAGGRSAVLIVRLSRERSGPGMGPALSRVLLHVSPTGSVSA